MRGRFAIAALAPMLLLALGGCGSSPGSSPAATGSPTVVIESAAPEAAQSQVGTGGELVAIQSDNVQAAGYDFATSTMTVVFHDGSRYEYYGVAQGLWEDFLAAQPHPWSRVGYPRLVKAGASYQRIG